MDKIRRQQTDFDHFMFIISCCPSYLNLSHLLTFFLSLSFMVILSFMYQSTIDLEKEKERCLNQKAGENQIPNKHKHR